MLIEGIELVKQAQSSSSSCSDDYELEYGLVEYSSFDCDESRVAKTNTLLPHVSSNNQLTCPWDSVTDILYCCTPLSKKARMVRTALKTTSSKKEILSYGPDDEVYDTHPTSIGVDVDHHQHWMPESLTEKAVPRKPLSQATRALIQNVERGRAASNDEESACGEMISEKIQFVAIAKRNMLR